MEVMPQERLLQTITQANILLAKKLFFKEEVEFFELNWKMFDTIIRWVVYERLKLRKFKPFHILVIGEVS
jgi:hypothetical protein